MAGDYTLAASELGAIRTLLAWKGTVGAGLDAPTFGNVERLMDSIAGLSAAHPGFADACFKGWIDQLFGAFVATPTSYALNVLDKARAALKAGAHAAPAVCMDVL